MAKKSVGTAYLLWALGILGMLGFHRFYLGRVGTGILWFITGGLGVLGALVDLFLIPKMVGDYNNPPSTNININVNKDDDDE